ncbi:HemK2/MTQ2 family protein methyltransferase [Haladaptatus sp. T7]|uniref:HemK2/MTQ2 family protein methyltransferase n=1 Tax=Haladaptatus sp. T7 TaxID=2029368 RepID=UPI0021A256B9|nr:HemK2/MTQ2 family protein methyltransferase [Haladaptatus sp. T7]GKZ13560.1 methyltransferase [Haladaptatus sp. T7]
MTDLAERRGTETKVYQPAEDSHLLAEVAAEEIAGDELVLEVGTGSGYVSEYVAEETGARVVGADVNPHACANARERGVEAVRTDLVSPFRDGAFDAVLFNPPYLPTDPDEERDDWMERALSGGESGREVIDPFLDAVGRVLAPGGRVFLLVSSLSGVEEVVSRAGENGFSAVALRDESFPFETLTILKLVR